MNLKIARILVLPVILTFTSPAYCDPVKGDSLVQLAESFLFKAPDSAAYYAKLAFLESQSDLNLLLEAHVLHVFGTICAVKGELDSAKAYYLKSLAISEKEGMTGMMSRTYNNLGLAYHEQGDMDEALKHYYKSLLIDEEKGDMEGVNGSRINIARIYSFQRRYTDALASYDSALSYFRRQENLQGMSLCLNNKGYIYQQLNDYDQALACFQEGLRLSEQEGDLYSIAIRLNNIARLQSLLGRPDEAMAFFKNAANTASRIQDKAALTHSNMGMAQVWLDLNTPDSALTYALKSLKLAQSAHAKADIRDSYEILHQAEARRGNFKKAYIYLNLFKSYGDSLYNLEKEKELNRLQLIKKQSENQSLQNDKLLQARQLEIQNMEIRTKNLLIAGTSFAIVLALIGIVVLYRTKKQKQKANKMLHRQNQEIISQRNTLDQQKSQLLEQQEKLRQHNDLKDKILSVISHDFRSPLNMIQSLLDLYHNDMLTDQELRDHLPVVSRHVEIVSELLNDLLTWARKQFSDFHVAREPVPAFLNADSAIKQLKPFAEDRRIEIINSIPKDVVVYTEEEVFRIITRNLVGNAMKFSPDEGKIRIDHREDGNFHWISVADEGNGISGEAAEDILNNRISKNSKKGKNAGIGLFISKQFIESSGGRIKIASAPGSGTTFSFGLPKRPE